jgi:predicted Zn-dependent protease
MLKPTLIIVAAAMLAGACSRSSGDSLAGYRASADRYVEAGEYDKAVIEYRNAIRLAPDSIQLRQQLGDALAKAGRTNEAYVEYAAAERIVGGDSLPYDEPSLRAAVVAHPDSAPARLALAEVLLAAEKTDEALAELRAAVSIDPGNELANRSLASVLIGRHLSEEAETRLRTAAAATPQRYRSQLALADFLIEAHRFADARQVLEGVNDPALIEDAQLRLADVAYEEGDVHGANDRLSTMIAEQPTPQAYTLQAQFRLKEGRLDEAMAAAAEALKLREDFEPAKKVADEIRQQQTYSDRSATIGSTAVARRAGK